MGSPTEPEVPEFEEEEVIDEEDVEPEQLTPRRIAERQTASTSWAVTKTPAARSKAVDQNQNVPLWEEFPSHFYAPSKQNARILLEEGVPGRLEFNLTVDNEQVTPGAPTPLIIPRLIVSRIPI